MDGESRERQPELGGLGVSVGTSWNIRVTLAKNSSKEDIEPELVKDSSCDNGFHSA